MVRCSKSQKLTALARVTIARKHSRANMTVVYHNVFPIVEGILANADIQNVQLYFHQVLRNLSAIGRVAPTRSDRCSLIELRLSPQTSRSNFLPIFKIDVSVQRYHGNVVQFRLGIIEFVR